MLFNNPLRYRSLSDQSEHNATLVNQSELESPRNRSVSTPIFGEGPALLVRSNSLESIPLDDNAPVDLRSPRAPASLEIDLGNVRSPAPSSGCEQCQLVAVRLLLMSFGAFVGMGSYYLLRDQFIGLSPAGRLPAHPIPTNAQVNFTVNAISPLDFINCTAENESQLREAHRRVTTVLADTFKDHRVALRNKTQENLAMCFADAEKSCVTYVCADTQPDCLASRKTQGFYRGDEPGNNAVVHFCVENTRNSDKLSFDSACHIAALVLHEVAHYVGVWKAPNHNYGDNGDGVWMLDTAARQLCRKPF